MTLDRLIRNRWVAAHTTSPQEIANLLAVADRDLNDCRAEVSTDTRFYIAHGAAIALAKAALAACGYKVSGGDANHYRLFQSLEDTIHLDQDTVDTLEAFRAKRNTTEYDMAGTISETEASEMVEIADDLRHMVEHWLRTEHPHLL